MKRKNLAILRRLLIWLTVITMLMGSGISAALAAPSEGGERVDGTGTEGTLTPPDYSYESDNVILHKQAVRTGETEWTVNVKVNIGEEPVQKRKLEVVFVLDCSGSMAWCADEAEHAKGSHTSHNDNCYRVWTCGKDAHTHSVANGCAGDQCTPETNEGHWTYNYRYGWYHSGSGCISDGENYYLVECDKEAHTHSTNRCTYTESKTPVCGRKLCFHNNSGNAQCYSLDENGQRVYYETRLAVAKEAINTIVGNLTKDDSDNIIINYVIFSSSGNSNGVGKNGAATDVGSLTNVTAVGGTYMYTGIQTGIELIENSPYKKVMVVVTDGAANDNASYAPDLNDFKTTQDGTVFTVGFAYSNPTLAGIAGNGGNYVYAANANSLKLAFESLEQSLTAMLEDPMGTSVDFEAGTMQEIHTAGGTISSSGDTIYWHPSEKGDGTVANSTIEYSYTVNLSEQAETGVGIHDNVPLNKTTYFYYGTKSGDTTTMKAVEFPIPIATYSYSSVKTTWKAGNTIIDIDDLKAAADIDQTPNLPANPTDEEKIIADTIEGVYIPQFQQSYDYAPLIVPISGSNDYYRYVGTTVTADGQPLNSVAEVDATKAVAYEVVHEYELVKASELYISGTKIMHGRDFADSDSFTFTLTPKTDDAPLPEGGELTLTPTLPENSNSVVFTFNKIAFTEVGTYEYTIQEAQGNLPGVIYDTAVRELVVNVTKVGTELVATPTFKVNGVEVKEITIVNSLETGSLKVEKSEVDSYNSEHQNTAFGFLIYATNVSNRLIAGTYEAEYTDVDGTQTSGTVTFVNGYATVQLKAGQSVVIKGLPDGATYTVTEPKVGGFTATVTGDDTGTIEANAQKEVAFSNAYEAKGEYQFIGNKTLVDATLAEKQFSFVVTDETGAEVATGENLENGMIYFDFIKFTHDDRGEKKYFIKEVIDNQSGILYDRTVHEVTLKITDKGDGTLSIEPVLAEGEKLDITFTNKHITGQMNISKTVSGNMGNRYAKFPFTLSVPGMSGQTLQVSADGGVTFNSVTLDASGTTTFELMHGQNIIFYPVSGAYTVTETANGSYTTTYSIDGGDAKDGTVASGTISADGSASVTFNNHLEMSPPTGVDTPTSAALVGIVMAMALLAIVCIGRRWRILEE